MYNNSSPMGLVLENPHDDQNSSCHTGVPKVYLQEPEFSMCPSRLGTLGFINLPPLFSVLEQSFPRRKTWYTHKVNNTALIFQPKGKGKYAKTPSTISLQPQNRSSLSHFAKEWTWPHSLEKIRECSSEMASDFTAPRAEEPSCTIIQTLQPHVLWPAELEMMKSVDFCLPEGTTTLSWGLEKLEVSDNQRWGF